MNKNLYLNNSEKDWLLRIRSILNKTKSSKKEEIILPPNNEIWYTDANNSAYDLNSWERDIESIFGANYISCTYTNNKGIIKFDRPVTKLGVEVFWTIESLTSINFPNSVTTIGNSAFYGCGLTSIVIPNSVTSIYIYNPFAGCNYLSSIVVLSDNPKYDSRNNCNAIIETETNKLIVGCKNTIIPNSITSIGPSAFSEIKDLTQITIPNTVTSIGEGAFYSCGLTSVTLPNILSIEAWAFNRCPLTSVTIPNSVSSIGEKAFQDCDSLTSITVEATTPPTLGINVFSIGETFNIYVPAESVETYKTAENWSTYSSYIQPIQ